MICWTESTHDWENHRKHRAHIYLTCYNHIATHLFDNRLANAQSQTTTSLVYLLVFCKITKVNKKLSELVIWNASAEVLDAEFEINIGCFPILRVI